jgi:hypothetical protein
MMRHAVVTPGQLRPDEEASLEALHFDVDQTTQVEAESESVEVVTSAILLWLWDQSRAKIVALQDRRNGQHGETTSSSLDENNPCVCLVTSNPRFGPLITKLRRRGVFVLLVSELSGSGERGPVPLALRKDASLLYDWNEVCALLERVDKSLGAQRSSSAALSSSSSALYTSSSPSTSLSLSSSSPLLASSSGSPAAPPPAFSRMKALVRGGQEAVASNEAAAPGSSSGTGATFNKRHQDAPLSSSSPEQEGSSLMAQARDGETLVVVGPTKSSESVAGKGAVAHQGGSHHHGIVAGAWRGGVSSTVDSTGSADSGSDLELDLLPTLLMDHHAQLSGGSSSSSGGYQHIDGHALLAIAASQNASQSVPQSVSQNASQNAAVASCGGGQGLEFGFGNGATLGTSAAAATFAGGLVGVSAAADGSNSSRNDSNDSSSSSSSSVGLLRRSETARIAMQQLSSRLSLLEEQWSLRNVPRVEKFLLVRTFQHLPTCFKMRFMYLIFSQPQLLSTASSDRQGFVRAGYDLGPFLRQLMTAPSINKSSTGDKLTSTTTRRRTRTRRTSPLDNDTSTTPSTTSPNTAAVASIVSPTQPLAITDEKEDYDSLFSSTAISSTAPPSSDEVVVNAMKVKVVSADMFGFVLDLVRHLYGRYVELMDLSSQDSSAKTITTDPTRGQTLKDVSSLRDSHVLPQKQKQQQHPNSLQLPRGAAAGASLGHQKEEVTGSSGRVVQKEIVPDAVEPPFALEESAEFVEGVMPLHGENSGRSSPASSSSSSSSAVPSSSSSSSSSLVRRGADKLDAAHALLSALEACVEHGEVDRASSLNEELHVVAVELVHSLLEHTPAFAQVFIRFMLSWIVHFLSVLALDCLLCGLFVTFYY